MFLDDKNQNDINNELVKNYEIDYIFSNKPINRTANQAKKVEKSQLLQNLKEKINEIKDCKLKENATKLVFSDGNIKSPLMIVGEGPGQKEDEIGKPFVGEAGVLLNKMLDAISIKREKIYITNVVNYRPPNNRKPEPSEIERY